MSQEDVEVVRLAIDASSRDDLAAFMATLDPAIEWMPIESDPGYAIHRGHDDVRAWLASWAKVFPDMRWEAERIVDAGGEVVVAIVRLKGRGEMSGLDVGTPAYGTVFTVRFGKIVRIHEYSSSREALEAAGLRE